MAKHRHLAHRIKTQAADSAAVAATGHPAVPGPMLLPLALVTVNPVGNGYVTLAMQDLAPIYSADGAALPATSPGRWDQLRLAGSGRYG